MSSIRPGARSGSACFGLLQDLPRPQIRSFHVTKMRQDRDGLLARQSTGRLRVWRNSPKLPIPRKTFFPSFPIWEIPQFRAPRWTEIVMFWLWVKTQAYPGYVEYLTHSQSARDRFRLTWNCGISQIGERGSPYGIRTRVTGVRGQRPRPLDERATQGEKLPHDPSRCKHRRIPPPDPGSAFFRWFRKATVLPEPSRLECEHQHRQYF